MLERRDEADPGALRRRPFSLARGATAPSGLVLAGGGVLAGELAHLRVEASVGIGLGVWLVRLVAAALRRERRSVRTVSIDPWAVPEPWRSLVQEAVGSRERFDHIVSDWPPGPMKERLSSACGAVSNATEEVWRIARLGASLGPSGPAATGDALSARLRALQESRGADRITPRGGRPGPGSAPAAGTDAEEESLAAQLQAVRRRDAASQEVLDRVRMLVAQLTVAVADLAGLALGHPDPGDLRGPAGAGSGPLDAIAALLVELERLRKAVDEVR